MFSHVMVGSNDIARSKKFYDALFIAIGGQPSVEDARGRLAYAHNGGRFMVSKPIDGKPATHANGGTIGFLVSDPSGPTHGTKPVSRMAARRSRTRLACAKGPPARYISPIFAIPTATNCARCIACRLPELSPIKTEEGRPCRKILASARQARTSRTRVWDPSRERSGGAGD